jgi:hypothetical protein
MSIQKEDLDKLLELANHYPSPHNGQPIRIRILDEDALDLYFENDRGLQATDISFIFSFVSMGVFAEHLKLCAESLGHELHIKTHLPREEELRGKGLLRFAHASIKWNKHSKNQELLEALLFRQTSRKKYLEGVNEEVSAKIVTIADEHSMNLMRLNRHAAKQAIWLNQRAVFDDMFDEPVRRELDHWLRYSRKQKEEKKDGLAYDCMELNGRAMRFIVNHPGVLRAPGISRLLREYYLRTMSDSSDVFYMLAPFKDESDSFEVGEVILKIWKVVAENRYYLHPFGTIMSNHSAHQDFVMLAGIKDESREKSYLVFIFRAGRSEKPVPSLRIPVSEHLIME